MKSKRVLSFIISLTMLLSVFPMNFINASAADSIFESGSGTETDPYVIVDADQFKNFRNDVLSGNTYEGQYIKLDGYIDLDDEKLAPGGTFSGTLDGNDKVIDNFYMNYTDKLPRYVGMFDELSDHGVIKGLTVNGNITGYNSVGVIAANNKGRIENCRVNVNITVKKDRGSDVGMIAGSNQGTIKDCKTSGKIEYNDGESEEGYRRFGGIAGWTYGGSIENCCSTVNITSNVDGSLGGIVGELDHVVGMKVSNCYYLEGTVKVKGTVKEGASGVDKAGQIEKKTADEMKNGSVAYLLQAGREELVWGQLISVLYDSPYLTSVKENKVYKITFMVKDAAQENGYKEYAVKYSNQNLNSFPQDPSPSDANQYTFDKWVIGQDPDGEAFTKSTTVTGDLTVYAVEREITKATDKDGNISLKQQEETAINLDDFVENKSGSSDKKFVYSLASGSSLPDGLTLNNGEISGKPTHAGKSTVKISVKNDGLVLMSAAYDSSDSTITLNLDVGLSGEGTEQKPYKILDLSSLEYLRDSVNSGNDYYANQHIRLTKDIDLGGNSKPWTPIGGNGKDTLRFKGIFDGGGHKITGLYVNINTNYVGLFGFSEGTIRNLSVSGDVNSNGMSVGGIVGRAFGTIENCLSDVNVVGGMQGGGIAGMVGSAEYDGKVENCCAIGKVMVLESQQKTVGGIVGHFTKGSVKNCYSLKETAERAVGSTSGYRYDAKVKTADEMKNGSVAYLLQNGQSEQFWGQKLSSDPYPVLNANTDDKVYRVRFLEKDENGEYTGEREVHYANAGNTISLPTPGERYFGWSESISGEKLTDSSYTVKKADNADADLYALEKQSVTFSVSGTNFIYKTDTPREITVRPSATDIKDSDVTVQYYMVAENENVLSSVKAVTNAITAGKYLYVIDIKGEAAEKYYIAKRFSVTDTALPDISQYDNIGYMYIGATEEQQDVFSVEDVPDTVYYGDTFTVTTYEASGNVSYEITNGSDIANIDSSTGKVTVTGVGKVTIRAKSTLAGYADRYAIRNFEAKKRVLEPTATATERTYDGTNIVEVSISLDNIANGDDISASAQGSMINADAGDDKIVYVSNIALLGDKKDLYTLSAQSLQTLVRIDPITITSFEITAESKKYDGTTSSLATVTAITGVLDKDRNQVQIVGNAEFDSAEAGSRTVTYTATSLSGAKAHNYTLGAQTTTATANIEKMKLDFVIGQTSFVYDGTDKSISVSASDENGRIFKDYQIIYKDADENPATPNEAGLYTAEITLDFDNYITTQQSIPVTINKATQDSLVIIGLPGTIQYGSNFDLKAVGGKDGGNYKWTVKDGADVTLSTDNDAATTVTIGKTVGQRVEIEVVKETENYNDITASVVFVPTAKSIMFDISDLEQTYDGNAKAATVAASDTGVTESDYTVTYNGSSELPENAGTYSVKAETNAGGNYSGTAYATLVIKKATANGSISGLNAGGYTYGDTIDGITATSDMGVNPTITYAGTGIYVPQSETPRNAGNYTVIATFEDPNYETLTLTENFVIKKAELKVKAEDKERNYGEANPIFTLTYDGFVTINGITETKDVLLSEPTATVGANSASKVGEYLITVSGGNAENYKFVYDNTGKMTIKSATGGQLTVKGPSNTVNVGQSITLQAYYGSIGVDAEWTSSDEKIATVDKVTGVVNALKTGTVTFTATAGENYGNATATFTLNVEKATVVLSVKDNIKTYNGDVQTLTLVSSNPNFVPNTDAEKGDVNVNVTYTLITDANVHEPKNAGEYEVVMEIVDERYSGNANARFIINKAKAELKPKDIEKEYGDEPSFKLVTDSTLITAEELEALTNGAVFNCDGADKKAAVGEYEITAVLETSENDNLTYSIGGTGKLTVTKAPLTISVKDATREYGAENPTLEAEFTGFKNDETEAVLTGNLALAYDAEINETAAVGEYLGKTYASGLSAENYNITYIPGNVTITKIGVKASAGTARGSYLTIHLDKAIAGLTADNFEVKNGENIVDLTSVTASNDNKTYTLNGSFTVGTPYTVTPKITSETHEIISGPLTLTPSRSGGGGGGGGSSASTSYTVSFETNGGSTIDSVKVKRNETVTKPVNPTKDGYAFDGWYSDNELAKEYDFSEKVTKSITLYTKWTKNETNPSDKPTDPEWKNPFDDVDEDDWFYDDVKETVEKGLFKGTSGSTFSPNAPVTRAMFVTVLYRAEGEPKVDKSIPFVDVATDSYFANAVIWAKQNGIVKGVSETEFAPDDNIIREQIAAIMHRYAKYKEYDISVGENTNILSYADFGDISEYAIEPMQYAVGSGLMKGKSETTLNPQDTATRAEIAAILQRFIEGNK